MVKIKISKEMFELQKSLCTGKAGKITGYDSDGDPIIEIVDYDVEAYLREKFEVEGE